MLVIGLTGGIGSGKSTVANLFAELGATIIDTDQLARDVTQPGQPALKKIAKHFGPEILLPDNSLNRSALRKIIFADDKNRRWLENLLHPLIRQEMERLISSATSPYCIAVIPLLLETKPNPLIDRILVVDASEEQQIARAYNRDNVSRDDIAAIIKTQVSREHRIKAAHDVITNTGSLEELAHQVEKLHQLYLQEAKNKK